MTLQTRKQTAARLGLSVRTLDTLVAARKLPHFKIGGAVRFDPDEIDAFLRKQREYLEPKAGEEVES